MRSEGFNTDAVGVAQVNNWFVDFYEQAGSNPFSGHGGFWKRLLSGAIVTEGWSNDARRGRRPQPLRQLDVDAVQHRRRHRRVGPAAARDVDAGPRGPRRERPREAARRARHEPAPGAGLLHAHELGRAGERPRRRGPGLAGAQPGQQPDVVRHPAGHPRRRDDLHRQHRGPPAPARRLERRRQHEPDQDDVQGLARPAAVPAVGDLRLLRHAPVDPGRALVGRRRRVLAPCAGLPRQPAPPRPRPRRRLRASRSTAATGRARASRSAASAGRAGA